MAAAIGLRGDFTALRLRELAKGSRCFKGTVITDDLTMPPVYHGGFCTAVTEALDAGVDLLLISFDGQQIYRALACAMEVKRHVRPL